MVVRVIVMIASEGQADWRLVAGSALALTVSTASVIQFSFGIFMKPLSADLGTDRGTLSIAPAMALLLAGISAPLVGVLTDRFGLRKVVFLSIVLTAVGLMLLGALARSVPTFIALYCLAGLVGAGYSPLPFAKAVSAKFQDRRGLALGITMAGVGIGTALVPIMVQALISAFGWRIAYVGLAIVVLIVALPATLLTLPDLRFSNPVVRAPLRDGLTAGESMRDLAFWKLAVAFALVAFATAGVITHIAPLLSDRGISSNHAATALSIAGITLILGRILSGYLLDRIFAPIVALLFIVSALVGILMLTSSIPASAWVATGLVGLSLGAEVDLIAYLLCRYLGQRAFGVIYGYLFGAFTLGTALGPLSMGQSFARTGNYTSALLVFMGGLMVACVLVMTLGAYRYGASGERILLHEIAH